MSKEPNLMLMVAMLKPEKVKEFASTLYEACLAMEAGGDYHEVFRRAKQRKVGALRRLYQRMEHSTRGELERIADRMMEGLE